MNWLKKHWVKIVIALVIIIGGCLFLVNKMSLEAAKTKKQRSEKLELINAYNGVVLKENTITTQFAFIDNANLISKADRMYKDCDDIQKYQNYEDMDTRDMSIQQLEEAIQLHPNCSYQIIKEKQARLEMLDEEISKLFGLSEQMQAENLKGLSKQIANQWREISTNEAEFTNQLELYAENTRYYWDVELGYKKKKTTVSRRNELFNFYDQKATNIDNKLVELDPKRKLFINNKNDTLNQLKALSPAIN